MVLSDVFISYSRKDSQFVETLNNALISGGKKVWIDWKDIPYSSKWWDEISRAVEGTSTFICILSPDYFDSKTCIDEVVIAEKLNKRIIPILFKEFEPTANSSNSISKINWIHFTAKDDFSKSFTSLTDTIDKDLDWVRFHTRLLVRALEWSNRKNDSSYHLYGQDLHEAQSFQKNEANKQPLLNTLQKNYIEASQSGAARLQRKQLRGFYIAALIYSIVQMFVIYIWSEQDLSETAMIKLSWVWLPALAFAIGGLTLGRYSIRTALIAMGVVMILFFLFFELLWGYL
jgi:TIR domain